MGDPGGDANGGVPLGPTSPYWYGLGSISERISRDMRVSGERTRRDGWKSIGPSVSLSKISSHDPRFRLQIEEVIIEFA